MLSTLLTLAFAETLLVPVQGAMAGADGQPLNGTYTITVALWRGTPGALSPVASTTSPVQFSGGVFNHAVPVDDSLASTGPVAEWITVELAGSTTTPVQVAYAPNALYARSADHLAGQSLADLDARYARIGAVQSGSLTAGSVAVSDLTPDTPGTLVPRSYLESALAAYVPLTGGAIGGNLSVSGSLTLGGPPLTALEAATKAYVDGFLPKSGGTMTGALTLAGTPAGANDAATKAYVDGFLSKAGGTMTGALTLAGAPSGTNDAANKGYVDGFLPKSGGTMTGTLTLAGTPSGANDAATKSYVDSKATAVGTIPEIFTYFGDDECPTGTTFIYSGVGFSGYYNHAGGSSDWSCVAPNDATAQSATHMQGYIYPMSIEAASYYPGGAVSFKRLKCAVCQVDTGPCFTYWGDDACPSTYPRKLWGGFSISAWYTHTARKRECIDLGDIDGAFPNDVNSYGGIVYPENIQLQGRAMTGYTPDRLLQCARCCKQ